MEPKLISNLLPSVFNVGKLSRKRGKIFFTVLMFRYICCISVALNGRLISTIKGLYFIVHDSYMM